MPKQTPFYLTTAIAYPNGMPHMGHAYEALVSDLYSRWYRFQGHEVFFLTGTDENGQKLVKAAEAAGQKTLAYVDHYVEKFRELDTRLNVAYDDFIRTTEKRHQDVCHSLWQKLEEKGDIYFDHYSGWYCLSCEAFYPETQAPDKKCPEHGTPLELAEEDGYFFKMSRYSEWILKHLKTHTQFVLPPHLKNEMIRRLEAEPLKDLSISRPNKGWGIPLPKDPKHVIYTWFDALINYYTATQKPQPADAKREKFWPADLHIIGRDILWFHSVIWPVMLHAADLPLPKQVYVHGMIMGHDGRKMSKSLDNTVSPDEVLAKYPLDSFRYYLFRAIPATGDGNFVLSDLHQRHHSELGNDFGNLLMRVVKLALKRTGGDLHYAPTFKPAILGLDSLIAEVTALMEARDHSKALDKIWLQVNGVNQYVNDQAPWKLKDDLEAFKAVTYVALHGIFVLACLLEAFMPHSAHAIFKSLGVTNPGPSGLGFEGHRFQLSEPPVLFPRIEEAKAD